MPISAVIAEPARAVIIIAVKNVFTHDHFLPVAENPLKKS
jgi:hypothetical protein